MRLRLVVCGVTAVASALLLTGCGVERKLIKALDVDSPGIVGRAFAGQQPVEDATISVIAMGTSGYGSTGTILASVTTDSGGNFSFGREQYTCPQSDTPVYLLGIGGNSGGGNNASAVLGAGLGTCANGKNSFVIMNEVTTVGLAFCAGAVLLDDAGRRERGERLVRRAIDGNRAEQFSIRRAW